MLEARTQKKVDDLFESWKQPGSPGCAVGIMEHGKLIYASEYGLANLEHEIPITRSTRFYVASMAKQFTGFAVALLAMQNRIDLDADIRTYLPYVPDFGHTITVKQLLYHTSGLRSDIFLLMLAGWRIEDVITQQDVLTLFKNQRELDFLPGEEFSYCGMGYSLLAEIVAKISGQPFPKFCAKHIFTPLGMTQTHFEADALTPIPHRAAAYLAAKEGGYKNAVLTISILGGTGLYTTLEDLVLWEENFVTGKVGGPAVFEMMETPGSLKSGETLSYGFGLTISQHQGRNTISHGGDSSGIHCYTLRFPSESLSVVILGNVSTLPASKLAYAVADLLLENPDTTPQSSSNESTKPETVDLNPRFLQDRAGRYFDAKSAAFIDLSFQDGSLTVYGYELSATSEDAFHFTQHPEATVLFSRSNTDSLRVTIDIGNGPSSYERVLPFEPTVDDLATFAGTYRSSELDTTWRVSVEGEALTICRRRHGTSTLVPVCTDVFVDAWIGELMHGNAQWVIAFDREQGHVTRLRVTAAAGRGRNLRFDKVE